MRAPSHISKTHSHQTSALRIRKDVPDTSARKTSRSHLILLLLLLGGLLHLTTGTSRAEIVYFASLGPNSATYDSGFVGTLALDFLTGETRYETPYGTPSSVYITNVTPDFPGNATFSGEFVAEGVSFARLSLGTDISSDDSFGGGSLWDVNWESPASGFIGFRFRPDGSSDYHYGWMEAFRPSNSSITINRYAYNATPGESIVAGQTAVPEPSTWALIGMGILLLTLATRHRVAPHNINQEVKIRAESPRS